MLFHWFNKDYSPRPNCTEDAVKCLGMPSGHAEVAAMLAYFLYSKRIISAPIMVLGVVLVCLQRVAASRHTVLQTVVGVGLGLCYALLYLNLSSWAVLVFLVAYTHILILLVDRALKPVPGWVQPDSRPIVEKKKNVPYYLKFMGVFACSFEQERTLYVSWQKLEGYLDKIVAKIKSRQTHFDAVVGIKSGGAILSDYVSMKLDVPQYKIKVTNDCNKTPFDSLSNYAYNYKLAKKPKYVVCEGIDDDLTGKNVILLDEFVASGTTMTTSMNYLKSKGVNSVYPISIYSNIPKIDHVLTGNYSPGAWAWGYDN